MITTPDTATDTPSTSINQSYSNNPRPLMPVANRPAPVMVRGEGSYLWDNNGKRYLDLIQGWAVNALGHCPPQMVNALVQQSGKLITPSPALHNAPQLALASRLTELSGLDLVHFSNSGSEANEVAIKLARKWGQVHRSGGCEIITTHNSFHGRTLAAMAATGKPGWDDKFKPTMPGFKKVPCGDINAMHNAVDSRTLAVMVEPIQGEAGVIVPPADYLQQLRDLTTQHGVLLILDEVQTGVGRLGSFFAFEQNRIQPDIVTLGKGLGGGVPVSATLSTAHACCFENGDQGGTFNGNPLMTAVALAVIDTVAKPHFLDPVVRAGERIETALTQIQGVSRVTDVRGCGLLRAIELGSANASQVQQRAMELGLLINAPRPGTIRLMPALNITDNEIDDAMALLLQAIDETT